MRGARSFGRTKLTQVDRSNRLELMIAQTRDENLHLITPERLASYSGRPLKECEYKLIIARQEADKRAAARQ